MVRGIESGVSQHYKARGGGNGMCAAMEDSNAPVFLVDLIAMVAIVRIMPTIFILQFRRPGRKLQQDYE